MQRFVDLCAGAGGLSLGLQNAGFVPLLVAESDTDSRATLRANTTWQVVSELNAETMGKPEISIIAGNLSSTGIGAAGAALRLKDRVDYVNAIELIRSVQPKAALLINVGSLLGQRFTGFRRELESTLINLDYQVIWRTIDSADFGLAQSRKRVVLLALKAGSFSRFEWPLGTPRIQNVGEALLPLMAENGWPGAVQWAKFASDLAPTIVGGSKLHGGADLGPTGTKKIWYSLGVDPRGIADSAPSADTPARAMPRLTNRMLATLQGFPEQWHFEGRKTSVYRQIARDFPPAIAEAIGVEVLNALVNKSADHHRE